jgi:hypothetical protein
MIITTNEEHIRELIEKARRGNTVRMIGIGRSMSPLVKDGRDYIDLGAVDEATSIIKHDVVFYKSHENKYVLHRIYSISNEGYYPNGDGNLCLEPLLQRDRIYLKAVGFVRKGKYISTGSIPYRLYSYVWTKLLPVRPHLLRWYNRACKVGRILKRERWK